MVEANNNISRKPSTNTINNNSIENISNNNKNKDTSTSNSTTIKATSEGRSLTHRLCSRRVINRPIMNRASPIKTMSNRDKETSLTLLPEISTTRITMLNHQLMMDLITALMANPITSHYQVLRYQTVTVSNRATTVNKEAWEKEQEEILI